MPIVTVVVAALGAATAHAQVDYAHYMESVQVVVDEDLGEVSAEVVLQSTNTDDVMLPESLERDLRENGRIIAIIFTDTEGCILGVGDEACVIINMARVPEETNIILVQDGARELADEFIPRLNEMFGVQARFHSVFVHHNDEQNAALGVPGIVAGYNTVSVTYTMPQRGAQQFLEMLVSGMLAPQIADGGGFVHTARALAAQENATVTFVAVPGTSDTLMMLKASRSENRAFGGTADPLEIVGVDAVEPSARFDDGFYPLNSLIRVAVASKGGLAVAGAEAAIIPMVDGAPADVTAAGWFFDPAEGTLIRGTYLMGGDGLARVGETSVSLQRPADASPGPDEPPQDATPAASAEGPIIIGIIVAAGIGAAVFYLKGYRRQP